MSLNSFWIMNCVHCRYFSFFLENECSHNCTWGHLLVYSLLFAFFLFSSDPAPCFWLSFFLYNAPLISFSFYDSRFDLLFVSWLSSSLRLFCVGLGRIISLLPQVWSAKPGMTVVISGGDTQACRKLTMHTRTDADKHRLTLKHSMWEVLKSYLVAATVFLI